VIIWKIVFENEEYKAFQAHVFTLGYAAWKLSWSLTDSLLAVSLASPKKEESVLIYEVFQDFSFMTCRKTRATNGAKYSRRDEMNERSIVIFRG